MIITVEKENKMRRFARVGVVLTLLAGTLVGGTVSSASAGPPAPANGHFCAQEGRASTERDQTPHAAVCFTNYSKYVSYLSHGRISLAVDAAPQVPDAKLMAKLNSTSNASTLDGGVQPAVTYTLMILYANASYGGTQYALNYSNHCSSSYTVQWASLGTFDNQTTSARMGDNCVHGLLFWDSSYGQPQYAFTTQISNVGTTFNDQASSATAKP